MKNLDNPLDSDAFMKCANLHFVRHHGLRDMSWTEIHQMIGSPLEGGTTDAEHYEAYLLWCKLANSPLYKALG
jgi:hypothetical protein